MFLSWSGEFSKSVATEFYRWIPCVVQSANPWISNIDVRAGSYWSQELQHKLKTASIGVLFVTHENLTAPWLNFEAGALSRQRANNFVCPFLIDLTFDQLLRSPLDQFQSQKLDKMGTWGLVSRIHQNLAGGNVRLDVVEKSFEKFWPDFESEVIKLKDTAIRKETTSLLARANATLSIQIGDQKTSLDLSKFLNSNIE